MHVETHALLAVILCSITGQGAVYTYDPVGNFERVGYSCQVTNFNLHHCMLAVERLPHAPLDGCKSHLCPA